MDAISGDVEFLEHHEARGLRLQLEYLQPEFALEKRGISHTIAVFGSTRIKPDSPWYMKAREFGERVAREGGAIVTGGGPGVMEAANRGAREAGGASIGMNISLPQPQAVNEYLTPGLSFQFRYFALRKLHLLMRARALVAFPGGYGTLDEVFETLMLVQTGKMRPLPIVLAGEAYWRRAFDLDFLLAEGMIEPRDRDLVCFADTPAELWDRIAGWYRKNGQQVFVDTVGSGTYPAHLARQRHLPDGRPVLIRPVHPDDEADERRLFAHLSPAARRNRFQEWNLPADEELARAFTHIDYRKHMAFVCTAYDGEVPVIVGEARYFTHPDGRSCEFGIVVADDWHHTGVAQLLMQALMQAAKGQGIETMASLVLSGNKDMLDFAAEFGFVVEPIDEDPGRTRISRKL